MQYNTPLCASGKALSFTRTIDESNFVPWGNNKKERERIK